MSWISRWWRLWQRQPVLWGIAGGYLLLGSLVTALSFVNLAFQKRWWPTLASSHEAWRTAPDFLWVTGLQIVNQGLSLLLMLLLVALLWGLRLAYPHPEQPIPWRAVWRGLLMALLRVLFVYTAFLLVLFLIVLIWMSLGIFLGLALVIVMALVLGPGNDQPALAILAGFGVLWLLVWLALVVGIAPLITNSLCEALGESRFLPPLWWRHMLQVTRRYWKRFLGLTMGQVVVMVISIAPLVLAWVLDLPSLPRLTSLVGWVALAGLDFVSLVIGLVWASFWMVAYFEAHEEVWGPWPSLISPPSALADPSPASDQAGEAKGSIP